MRIRALAKINLSLEVLNRRPDGYHNLRTIFQTVSLADTLELCFTPGSNRNIELASATDIPNNLALRAAAAVYRETNPGGRLTIRLLKKIPIGAGLGGGSADAAAVLLALPVLTGRALAAERALGLAAELGSDVAFFLLGGTVLGLGRGNELYSLPDASAEPGLVAMPDLHVSTADAYTALNRTAELPDRPNSTAALAQALPDAWHNHACNDFEAAILPRHPEIARLRDRLRRLGASVAMMSGSGASVFALFDSPAARSRAAAAVKNAARTYPITLVSRRQYQRLWWRQLTEHIDGRYWPPRSRYGR